MDDEALMRKFRANAKDVLPAADIDALINAVFELERIQSLNTLGALLAG